MTPEQFINTVLEHLFIRGYDCSCLHLLTQYAHQECGQDGAWPEVAYFSDRCIHEYAVAHQPERLGKYPSPTAGASDRWLAVHEAGHAIVGVRSGLTLRGIRFYGEGGPPGEAGFEEFVWRFSADEASLQRHIRVDVAANLAELLLQVREPDGGRPSLFFDRRDPFQPGDYPSDIVDAWKCARHLATLQFTRSGRALDPQELLQARRAIVAQAEVEAEQILKDNMGALTRLAEDLQLGPMTGAAVRAILAAPLLAVPTQQREALR